MKPTTTHPFLLKTRSGSAYLYVVYVQATGPRCPTEGAPQVSPTSKRLPPPPPAQCVSPNLTPASAASLVWHNYKVRVVALKLIFEKTPMYRVVFLKLIFEPTVCRFKHFLYKMAK